MRERRGASAEFTTRGTKTHEGGVAVSAGCVTPLSPSGRGVGGEGSAPSGAELRCAFRREPLIRPASPATFSRKGRRGRPRRSPELLDGLGVRIVAIDERHALAPVEPEPMTRDPFDRMLLAQCQVEGLRLLTIDRALVSHPLAARG
jgi:hypothetical protein